jgi:hypothetical protein
MRDFYKKYFHSEEKKPRKSKMFIIILITNILIIYLILNKKLPEKQEYNIKLKSSKLTTTLSKLPINERMGILDTLDELEYIVQAEVINKNQSNTFVFEAFILSEDSIFSKRKEFILDSNVIKDIEIQFPKMKRLTGKRSYKIGVVK